MKFLFNLIYLHFIHSNTLAHLKRGVLLQIMELFITSRCKYLEIKAEMFI